MLKPQNEISLAELLTQPPSGGCVLKHKKSPLTLLSKGQPPSGGCVLKPRYTNRSSVGKAQPPSGGCVLKPLHTKQDLLC